MDYVSVRVSTLRGDQQIGFDAYVKINEKMILYLRRGDEFSGPRLLKLKQKKLKKMYIATSDESSYLDYLQKNIEVAYDKNSTKDINTRAEIIHGAQQSNAEEVFDNPGDVAAYNLAKDAAGKYVDFLFSNDQALSSILKIENADASISHHGVSVSTIAVALCEKLKIDDPKKIQLVSLGALLHDFGHNESHLNISRPLAEFSKEDLEIYKKHAKVGAAKIQDKKHFDQTVINIIAQHEEKIDGSGFLGLKEKQLDPLSIIVSLANVADRMISFDKTLQTDVAKKMMIERVGQYPLGHIQQLAELFKKTN
ncbi:MAG: HD-GYP domain-containing protein [Pseudobdellovibrionaceae bacterium]